MRKILTLLFVLMSAKSLMAIDFPKDTLWRNPNISILMKNAIFSKNESRLFVNTSEGLAILDTKNGKEIAFYSELSNSNTYIMYESEDSSYMINNHFEKINSSSRQIIWKCPTRDKSTYDIEASSLSQNGKYISRIYFNKSLNNMNNVDIYNVDNEQLVNSYKINVLQELILNKPSKLRCAISNNMKYMMIGALTKSFYNDDNYDLMYLVDVETGKTIKQIYQNKNGSGQGSGEVFAVTEFSSNNNYALAKWNNIITILNLNNFDSIVFPPNIDEISGSRICGISDNEKYLFTTGVRNGSVDIYDLENHNLIYTADKISNFNGASLVTLNKNNNLMLIGSGFGLFMIDLKNTLTDIQSYNKQLLTINPNPSREKLILSNPQNHQINTLTAYDILGRTYPLSANGNEVDVSALAAGRYFLKVGLADGSFLDFGFVKE